MGNMIDCVGNDLNVVSCSIDEEVNQEVSIVITIHP